MNSPLQEEVRRVTGMEDPAERFYYNGSRYFLDSGSEYIPMDQKSVGRHLREAGLAAAETDAALCRIQLHRHIHFAGPLAGHERGLHTVNGHKLLATVSPRIIPPVPGGWPLILSVVRSLLADPLHGETQVETFCGWLKCAVESLRSGARRPGQALALAGPRGSGKTLMIEIVQLLLGNRRANPYPYFSGRTNFNADLAGAELLAVDDEAGSTDIRSRRTFATNIKSCLFAGSVRIEGKNKTAFTFRPCWRMMLALNDEPEALLVLPPLTEDIADKIILFQCQRVTLPMPAHTLAEREKFFTALQAEVPAFLSFLESWTIPEPLREERCGVRAFHHPTLLHALSELSPERQLLGLIDAAHESGQLPLPWTGTANELKGVLCHCPRSGRDAERLLGSWMAATGCYLGRLAGERVEKLINVKGIQRWRIREME